METLLLLKQIQAEAMIFYTKCFNLHWNTKGSTFLSIHKYTEDLYEDFQEIFDYIAEKIVQMDMKPYTTLSEMLAVSRIEEEINNEFQVYQALEILAKDLKHFEIAFKALSKVADTQGHRAIANYADEIVDKLQKYIWKTRSQQGI